MEKRIVDIPITTEMAKAAATRVLPPLIEHIETGYNDEIRVESALTQAFLEGVRFANAEILAGLIEADIEVHTHVEMRSALDSDDAA